MLDLLPTWVLPTLAVVVPFALQYAPESMRVTLLGAVAGIIAAIATAVLPGIVMNDGPYLAWALFGRLVVGYTAAKVPLELGAAAKGKMAAVTMAWLVLLFGACYVTSAWAQGEVTAEDGGLREIVAIVIGGLVSRLGTWLARKVKGRK